MNSAPDRAKGCLPPKKRESRQSSSEQHPPDHFKPPAPLRNRSEGRMAEVKGPVKAPASNSHHGKDLFPPPPSVMPTAKFALPWPPHSPPTIQYSLLPNQTGEQCGSKLPIWPDQCSRSMDHGDHGLHPHRWPHAELPMILQQRPISSYKTRGPLDSRDLWPHHFSRPTPYPNHHLDGRRMYTVRKFNGLEAADSRVPSRSSAGSGFSYDGKGKQDSSQTNGKRRYQEDQRIVDRTLLKGSRAQEGPSTHSSSQDRDLGVTLKASAGVSDRSTFSDLALSKSSLASFSLADTPGEAHIYYALGPMHHSLPPLAHPLQSHLGPGPIVPLYGLHTEEPHALKNSQLSPLVENQALETFPAGQYNSHDTNLGQSSKGAQSLPSHQSSSGPYGLPTALQPSAFLPHFTKGSLIELSGGHLRRVEDLQTEDFLLCANTSPEFHLSFCTVLLISSSSTPGFSNLQVLLADRNTQELLKVLVEYPFFVRDRGWSSCCPQRTAQLYGLRCRQLSEGDVCLALTPVPSDPPRAPSSSQPSTVASRANAPRAGTTALAAQRTPIDPGAEGSVRREANFLPPGPPPQSPAPPSKTSEPPSELTSARKRRWSAPGLLAAAGPQDSPHMFRQRDHN